MPLPKGERSKALIIVSSRVEEAAEVMKAMASETRLKIMCALSEGELPVNQLAQLTGQSQSAVSQHLAKLRAAGLVTSRRAGQTIHYRCRAGIAQQIIDTLCGFYSEP
ncbi:putative transcriptional regulator NolR [Hyphomonas neptunium ATCC 15444]|uniref:Putative transcriptional regulator NolR n=2 Tax=Hyphomonas TaxID=85 RepID=Q0BZG7_HYPNA|nr:MULTISPECIES: metalloregulator ArsR/SmtB family transcription factor [Hyphomonas]ABI75795.1 putative transcriptional regulator NolR [Hyphomonas neptunium ATCC 15444]KCZ95215.1 putative transcriptional regulator NolR [Hyphomonas hirschiana VP5]